ncbi:EpsG family protein [Phocaeicola sp.]
MCIVFLLSFVGGMRDIGVGTDTITYSENYFFEAKHLSSWEEFVGLRRDRGYVLLNYIAIKMSENLWMAQFIIQLFTHGLIFFVAYRARNLFKLKISLFTLVYCCIFYNQTYNFMRQYCALALLLVGLYYALNKQWKLYVVCQLCAFFFHSTSLLFMCVPILYYACMAENSHKWRYFVVLSSILFVLIISAYYYEALALLNSIDIVSDVYANRYGIGDEFGEREGLRKSLVLIIICVFYFIYIAYKRAIVEHGFAIFLLSINLFFIAFYLLSFYSIYLYRLSLYFYLPMMLFIVIIASSRKTLELERAGFVMLVLLDWYIYIVKHNGAESFPYQSKILGI